MFQITFKYNPNTKTGPYFLHYEVYHSKLDDNGPYKSKQACAYLVQARAYLVQAQAEPSSHTHRTT